MENSFLVITVHDGFVHVELQRDFCITLESMRGMWCAVLPTCEQQNCRRVLVEGEQPTRSMGKLDAFEHGRIVADLYLRGLRVAFCLYGYEPDELSHLFTMVANGSFNSARFFDEPEKALRWLRG